MMDLILTAFGKNRAIFLGIITYGGNNVKIVIYVFISIFSIAALVCLVMWIIKIKDGEQGARFFGL